MTDHELPQTSAPKRILCVDDDVDTCEMMSILLGEYHFAAAHSLDAAVRSIDSESFDLYIFDNWMPGGSGLELCRKVRERGLATPIIFVSGAAQSSDIDEAKAAGADKYLIKPCEPNLLRQVVKELIFSAA